MIKRYAVMSNVSEPGRSVGPNDSCPVRVMYETDKPYAAAMRAFAIQAKFQGTKQTYIFDRWCQLRICAPDYVGEPGKPQLLSFLRWLKRIRAWKQTYGHYKPPHYAR